MGLIKKRSGKSGMPPGSLVYVGENAVEKTQISVIDFSPGGVTETTPSGWTECETSIAGDSVTWVNITGLGDTALIEQIGESLDIHPLVLEDILNTGHRPKVEDYENFIFMILKMLYSSPDDQQLTTEQVSVIFGRGYVISFQEVEGDVFEPIRKRIRSGKGRIRKSGSEYLAYTLLDAIVDNSFLVLEELGDRIEILQDRVLEKVDPQILKEIYQLKQMIVMLRKGVMPVREVAADFLRLDSDLVKPEIQPYLRDAYEHTVQVIDLLEMLRDLLSATLDTHMTMMSNRMNSTMQILTVIATIFIPLTFLVGVYGMNFEHMPELGWRYGYAAVWGLIVVLGVFMFLYFRKKKIL